MKFVLEIHRQLKADNLGYEGSKPITLDWADILEEELDFTYEFKRVFNNSDIPEADYFTSEVLEDTYVDMEITLSRDG